MVTEQQDTRFYGQHYRQSLREKFRWFRLQHVLYALLTVGLAYIGALLLEENLPPAVFQMNNQNVVLLFVIACAFTAGRFGLLPGLVASFTSFLIVNYYFTPPYYSLKFYSLTDILNLSLFLSAALCISFFTSQAREYAKKSAKRELNTQALFTLYRIASTSSSRWQALEKLQGTLSHMLGMDVAFFLPSALNLERIEPAFPKGITLSETERKALDVCWKETKTTGLASLFESGIQWRFEAMLAPGGKTGVLAVRPRKKEKLDMWFGRLLTAIADQTAAAIEHIELERAMETTRIREEREKLRSMLLSSVSHDLKTPLASIIGALGVCRNQGNQLTIENQKTLIETAFEEAVRLDSFITNILDITRLESGKIIFRHDWHNAEILVKAVIKRLGHRLRHHQVVILPCTKNIEIYADVTMTSQVIQNLLDNAYKYTPAGTRIEVRLYEEDKGFCYEVHDYGAGLPPDKLERIFDKYARLQMKDSQVAGTGLGLAICKAVMEAQGGTITAENHPESGAVFTLRLPQWRHTDISNTS